MRKIIACVGLGLFVGCAAKQLVSPKATVRLEKSDIRELQEAFKSVGDKVVQLPTRGEVNCANMKCTLPLDGTATVLRDGKPSGTEKVDGHLVVEPTSLSRLVSLLDQAANKGKTLEMKGTGGNAVSCNAKRCDLSLAWDETHDTALGSVVPERGVATERE